MRSRELYQKCADEGLTVAETAKRMRVTVRAVHYAADRLGISFAKPEGWEENPRQKYEECAAKGMTQGEAARHLGVYPSAVSSAASRYGIKFASCAGRKAGIPTLGYPSLSAAARAMGIHRRVLVKKLAKVSPK